MDILIYILYTLILLFYLIYIPFRKKINVKNNLFKYSITIHYICLSLILFNYTIELFDFNLRGRWTTKIIMWFYLLTSFVIQFKSDFLKSTFEKIYFKILLFFPSIFVISWIIPMIGAYICYSFMLLFNTYKDNVLFDNHQFKICFEEGFLLHDYEFEIYKKNFIFEHKIKSVLLNDMNFDKIISIKEDKEKLNIKFREYDTQKIMDTTINLRK